MTEFTRTLTGFRRAPTYHGDTLQKIAARELGSASLWYRLIYINELRSPYITDNPGLAGPGVLLTGQTILLPASGPASARPGQPESVFGADVRVDSGRISVESGDLAVVSGPDNLGQALRHRLLTRRGELLFHLAYGCSVRQVLGRKGNARSLTSAGMVKRALLRDTRVRRVISASASLSGDVLSVAARVETFDSNELGVTV